MASEYNDIAATEFSVVPGAPKEGGMFRPGEVWKDTDGKPIRAHGGGILRDNGIYYWYGEDKGRPNRRRDGVLSESVDIIGIHVYSSVDLLHWEDRGIVLPAVPDNESHDLFPANVLERPKAVRIPSTGKYVLWAHVDSPDYSRASLGVAISDSPVGPFTYLHSFRPYGHDSRDMTLFQDTDGATYVFFSSEGPPDAGRAASPEPRRTTWWNATQRIARLSDDGLLIAGEPSVAMDGEYREAPAVFRWRDNYYQITSGCTGWRPNPARWHIADHPLGPWTTGGDPCVDDRQGTTFDSQSTFILPLPGQPDEFLFLADRWKPKDLQDSRYVWLRLSMKTGEPRIEWRDAWEL
ncbi:MAG: glycoside hydrolase family 43 protein [Bacteroidia bacterium]|nr:glycoside hydrolase family 43 protein [Bacteroidia bacterium]